MVYLSTGWCVIVVPEKLAVDKADPSTALLLPLGAFQILVVQGSCLTLHYLVNFTILHQCNKIEMIHLHLC